MDDNEIQQIYKKYGFMIHGRCQRILGSSDDAADATQVVFMQLITHYDSIRDKSQIVPWIFRAARNYCFNLLRNRKKFIDAVPADEVAHTDDFDEQLGKDQILALILRRVNDKVRDAVHYTYIEELDQRAINKLTGQSPATIRRNLKRFKELLPAARRELGI